MAEHKFALPTTPRRHNTTTEVFPQYVSYFSCAASTLPLIDPVLRDIEFVLVQLSIPAQAS